MCRPCTSFIVRPDQSGQPASRINPASRQARGDDTVVDHRIVTGDRGEPWNGTRWSAWTSIDAG
jgi:hypothetical protein